MPDFILLKERLDTLISVYGAEHRDADPIGLVHRYQSQLDKEIAGFIVSTLAFGKVSHIRQSASRVLAILGESPCEAVRSLSFQEMMELYKGIRHRWVNDVHIANLISALGSIIRDYGSLGRLVQSLHDSGMPTVTEVMIRFSKEFNSRAAAGFFDHDACEGISSDFRFSLVPSPASGCSCKRLALFFRWMVRNADGVDMGLWSFLKPSQLIVPLDTHMARLGRLLGLTSRITVSWKMALEITESLRRMCPDDPLKYDFPLVKLGTLGICRGSRWTACRSCILEGLCEERT